MKIKTASQLLTLCLLSSCMSTNDLIATPRIAGGYADTEINNDIKAAAEFAVQTQTKRDNKPLELLEISNARQQVVAGMNYEFEVTVKSAGALRSAAVVVFQSLHQTYELSSWQWLPAKTTK